MTTSGAPGKTGPVTRSAPRAIWYALVRFVSRIAAIALFDYRVYNPQRVPRGTAVVLAANHQSFLDPWLVGLGQSQPVAYLARDTLFRFPAFAWLIGSLNAVPVARGSQAARQGVESSVRILESGLPLVLFPEGTRSLDGARGPLKRGFHLIARRARVAVMPVLIDGAFEVWPRHRALPTPGPVRVHFGDLIPLEVVTGVQEGEKPGGADGIVDNRPARPGVSGERLTDAPEGTTPDGAARKATSAELLEVLEEAYRALAREARKRRRDIHRGLENH